MCCSESSSHRALEIVPQPSLKIRPFRSTSGRTAIVEVDTNPVVSVKACPILAAHLAGDLMVVKSPISVITRSEPNTACPSEKGRIIQHVCARREEEEKPKKL